MPTKIRLLKISAANGEPAQQNSFDCCDLFSYVFRFVHKTQKNIQKSLPISPVQMPVSGKIVAVHNLL